MGNRSKSPRYYAVVRGRDGPSIYTTWPECEAAVSRLSHNMLKKFETMQEARQWLDGMLSIGRSRPTRVAQRVSNHHRHSLVKQPDRREPWRPTQFQSQQPQNPLGALAHKTSGLAPTDDATRDITLADYDYWEDEDLTIDDLRQDSTIAILRQFDEPTTAAAPALPPVEQSPQAGLSIEQLRIFQSVAQGGNVFFTGSAGVGKSVLLRAIICHFHSCLHPDAVAVTATTGIAAQNIGGRTIHSFAGCGYGREDTEELGYKVRNNRVARDRWRRVEVLIMDEVGMLGGDLLDKLDYIARFLRGREEPFGGIQLVFSGDFLQLPPIGKEYTEKSGYRIPVPAVFAFDSDVWNTCFGRPLMLTQVFRQRDESFASVLNALRTGRWSLKIVQSVKSLDRRLKYDDGIDPVYLFATKAEVETRNSVKIGTIQVCSRRFTAVDSCGAFPDGTPLPFKLAQKILDKEVLVEKSLWLKVGAQVMLLRNVVQGRLVNGSVGKIIDFIGVSEANQQCVEIAQLAPAGVEEATHLSEDFKIAERRRKQRGEHRLVQMTSTKNMFGAHTAWPLVQFTNGTKLLCAPLEFNVEGMVGNLEARRLQVPLMLSWAITVHKSQGQSIERLCVDLTKTFECGQAYVALSRATNLETLEVRGFDPVKVRAHQRVVSWTAEWMSEAQWRFTWGDDQPFPTFENSNSQIPC